VVETSLRLRLPFVDFQCFIHGDMAANLGQASPKLHQHIRHQYIVCLKPSHVDLLGSSRPAPAILPQLLTAYVDSHPALTEVQMTPLH